MRLFSIIQWHHFAYMIISLALLGYGASGALVTVLLPRIKNHTPGAYVGAISLFGVSAIICFLVAQALPFNAEELLWDVKQPLLLLLMYVLLAVPFFFAATAIAIALSSFPQAIGRIYAFDLFGAGLGGVFILALLFHLFPLNVLSVLGVIAFLAAVIASLEFRRKRTWKIVLASLVPTAAAVLWALNAAPGYSPYKELVQILRIADTSIDREYSSPLGLISAVKSSTIPLRHAPGLSLTASTEPPPQIGVFTDGGGMTAITKDRGVRDDFAYLDQMTSALAYHLSPDIRHALIIGAGGGSDVLQARYHNVESVTAVELNPQVVNLVSDDYREFSGDLYHQHGIEIVVDEARGFVSRTTQRYGLIQVSLMDAFGASSAGLYALNENYLYTVESLQSLFKVLNPGGYLSISRWIKLPPRDTFKLLSTAISALEKTGVKDPANHILLVRSWQTSTLVIKNSPITKKEISQVKNFCKSRLFDVAWYPGMPESEANRINRLKKPWFHIAARELMSAEKEKFLAEYKFNIAPVTDDRPYFFHFFKWSALPEILSLRKTGGMPLLEQGYLVSVVTLLQALVASLVLILLPLWLLNKHAAGKPDRKTSMSVIVYFSSIGLAFLLIEIAFIQKFILVLHHPIYSVATVMSSFLVFAGLGSLSSGRIQSAKARKKAVTLTICGIGFLSTLYLALFQVLPSEALSLSMSSKFVLSVTLIAPLAFLMGFPFPLALSTLGEHHSDLIPWAWGINGCASVISAVLATLIAIQSGFSAVILIAVMLYLLAGASYRTMR